MIKNKLHLFQIHYDRKRWKLSKIELRKKLQLYPDDHYLLVLLGSIYREEKRYTLAWKYIYKAFEINPYCPTVMWHFADISFVIGEIIWAQVTWQKLLKMGYRRVAFGKCGEGSKWALSLINDTRYRLAMSYLKTNPSLAKRYFTLYRKQIKKGVKSIYKLP